MYSKLYTVNLRKYCFCKFCKYCFCKFCCVLYKKKSNVSDCHVSSVLSNLFVTSLFFFSVSNVSNYIN